MKTTKIILTIAILASIGIRGSAQGNPEEYLGLPGDNLNLYAVMKLFQESETLEGFERKLNAEDSRINNLDLNNDNLIDYITVTDFPDGNDHTIVLRVPLGPKDFQDVAVFTVNKLRDGSVQVQLIGDEELYGKNYIIEPIYEETPNPGYVGNRNTTTVTVIRTTPYEISYWPLIRYIYMPDYVVWRSSWYWGYYPGWWRPWNPFSWHYYYGYHYYWYDDYYAHYHHWDYCRWNRYNDYYVHSVRAHSPIVEVNITKNVYKTTYSHPEQRRDGEALYLKSNPDRAASQATRRSSPVDGQLGSSSRSGGSQVSSERPVNRSSAGSGSSAVRSSAPSRSSSDVASSRSSGSSSKGSAAPAARSSEGQRSAPAVRSESPSSGQRSSASPSRSSSQNQNNAVAAPSRSSSQRSSSVSPSRSSSKSSSSGSVSRSSSQRSSSGSVSRSSGSRSSGSGSSSSGRSSSSSSSKSSGSSESSSRSGRR